MKDFLSDESGAVMPDWLVLSFLSAGLALLVVVSTRSASEDLGETIEQALVIDTDDAGDTEDDTDIPVEDAIPGN